MIIIIKYIYRTYGVDKGTLYMVGLQKAPKLFENWYEINTVMKLHLIPDPYVVLLNLFTGEKKKFTHENG